MKEYIERAAVLSYPIRKDHCDKKHANEYFIFGIESVMEYVENLPTADVVEVVRCRECRHSSLPSCFTQRYGEPGTLSCNFGPCNRRNVNENDFCPYGQRKKDEQ